MAKVMYLFSCFLLGCITSSSVAYLSSLHVSLSKVTAAIYIVLFAVWALSWLADDAIAPYLKLKQHDYYGLLIAVGIALVTGGAMQWLLG
ncbi:hypothetical protein CAL7716_034840 [Calothrix sp. PCC 7716]|nr:hypothetical protein CAL7716_034840 [Calothrix sp. PCC 7716]